MASGAKRRRRQSTSAAASEARIAWTLPADLLLEIIARSNACALVCCAATCKLLRRDILDLSFIRRVSHQAAPHILAYLRRDSTRPFTLIQPATPAAASFCHDHLFPFFSRRAADLFQQCTIVFSRHGLVLLCSVNRPNSDYRDYMSVYDPMSGARTFFSRPPKIKKTRDHCYSNYVLLTAADGIDGSFLLLFIYFCRSRIKVQTASPCGSWSPHTYMSSKGLPWDSIVRHHYPAVLHGGIMHWLVSHGKEILSYDVCTRKTGSIELPHTGCEIHQLYLTTSDGKLLKLLVIERFILSVWLQLPISSAPGSGWSLETMIDMEEKLRSVHPNNPLDDLDNLIVFCDSQKRGGDVVLLHVPDPHCYGNVTVFNLETKDMHIQKFASSMLEIDLPSRLQNMKIFS